MKNLVAMFNKADKVDRAEGRDAYFRYNRLMMDIADHYSHPSVPMVTAAFVALSPNNDYKGNLRSLVSVLSGLRSGVPEDRITVSTYKHCRDRAISYVTGRDNFMGHAKGLKTRAFFVNVSDPVNDEHVTIDGHVYAAWRGEKLTMKEAKVSNREYREIQEEIIALSKMTGLIPNQFQATIWFTRKRLLNILFPAQGDLFHGVGDLWRTSIDVRDIRPYEPAP
jgi:hypothetical protein